MSNINPAVCKRQLARARWLGFTSVTVTPSFFMHPDGTFTPAVPEKNLENCLNQANALGFDLIYKPSVEFHSDAKALPEALSKDATLEDFEVYQGISKSQAPWRAKYNFSPGGDYQKVAIDPFVKWMEKSRLRGSGNKVSLVVATELHTSIIEHAQDWNNLMWNLRQKMKTDGLRTQVEIGIDPTVFGREPYLTSTLTHPLSAKQCEDYNRMLWTADFFAPSIYGDYIAAGYRKNLAQSIDKMFDGSEKSWEEALRSRGCRLPQSTIDRLNNAEYNGRDKGRTTKTTWAGEIGYAGNLTQSWNAFKTDRPPYNGDDAAYERALDRYEVEHFRSDNAEFVKEAPHWVNAILQNARGSYRKNVSFWTVGRFDLFGFSNFPPLGDLNSTRGQYTKKDPIRGPDAIPAEAKIRDLLQGYTRERCAGWQPELPRVAAVPKPRSRRKKLRSHRGKIVVIPGPYDCVTVTAPLPPSLDTIPEILNQLIQQE